MYHGLVPVAKVKGRRRGKGDIAEEERMESRTYC